MWQPAGWRLSQFAQAQRCQRFPGLAVALALVEVMAVAMTTVLVLAVAVDVAVAGGLAVKMTGVVVAKAGESPGCPVAMRQLALQPP